jgi:type I restriction-modification system DNA methylase subunit
MRGAYKPNEYDKVILPLLVLRRLDRVLAPTKKKVLARLEALRAKGMKPTDATVDVAPRKVSGVPFYNTSKLDFATLKGDPNHLAQNLRRYKAKDDEAQLSEIIDVLNERFGPSSRLTTRYWSTRFKTTATLDSEVVERANANSFDNFALAIKSKLEDLMVDRMERNEDVVTRYLNDPQFQSVAFPLIARQIFDTIREHRGDRR